VERATRRVNFRATWGRVRVFMHTEIKIYDARVNKFLLSVGDRL
jgi:hypothetical protein